MPGKNANSKRQSTDKPRKGRAASKHVSSSTKAGIVFPPARLNRMFRQGRYSARVGAGAGVFAAAVLEYITSELCELAGNAADEHKKKTIKPRHLLLAIRNDEELNKLVAMSTIATGGVLPNVQSFLFAKKNGKAKQEKDDVQ